jgi:hypothetical protein
MAFNAKHPFYSPIFLKIGSFERASNSAQKKLVYVIDKDAFLMVKDKKK